MRKIVCLLSICIACALILLLNDKKQEKIRKETSEEEEIMDKKIHMYIEKEEYVVLLEDSKTAQEFVNLLPLTISMNELNGNEKYFYMNKNLPTDPIFINTIHTGDILLYQENCLVLFYEDFSTPYAYTRLGKVENPIHLKEKVGEDSLTVTFTK